uniref:zinc-binding dehydrogenase n=1 Tax=Ornithinibacillus sp. FSL M8-0202 TaxID=2921616 RepID=UPI00403F185E
MLFGPFISMTGNKKMATFLQQPNQGDLIRMKELIESGKVKPVIDRSFSLQEVPEALMYFEEGHSQGKIVITIC